MSGENQRILDESRSLRRANLTWLRQYLPAPNRSLIRRPNLWELTLWHGKTHRDMANAVGHNSAQ